MQQSTNEVPQAYRILDGAWDSTRIVQCIQAHNEERFIQPVLRSIYNEVDRIIVIEGATVSRPNRTDDGHSIDRTVELIKEFIEKEDRDKKVLFIQKDRPFVDLEELKNTFLHHISDGEWIIINDCDEFYRPEDIRHVRELTYIYHDAIEFVPLFLHFYRDLKHIIKPDEENQPQHQRIVRYRSGMHYRSHPVLTFKNGICTYFTPQLQKLRYIVPNMYIYHLGFVKPKEEMIAKREFYSQELMKHGDRGVEAHDEKTEAFLNYTEDLSRIARYEDTLPDCLSKIDIPLELAYKDVEFDDWRDVEPYNLDAVPQCWVMTKTGQWNDFSNKVHQ
jgi:hypothetical protein